MTASGIVPAFDEVEECEARVGLRAETLLKQHLLDVLDISGPDAARGRGGPSGRR
jgi:hypothetical protein